MTCKTMDIASQDPELWRRINQAYLEDDQSITDLKVVQTYRDSLLKSGRWFVPERKVSEEEHKAALVPYEDLIFDEHGRSKITLHLQPYVDLARILTGMQMALVGIMTDEHEYCVVRSGSGFGDGQEKFERAGALCDYTVQRPLGTLTEFKDIPYDWRLNRHPFNTGESDGSARSYVGVPLTTSAGVNIGTLCCLDVKPRQRGWKPDERAGLKLLAQLVMRDLDLQLDKSLALDAKRLFVAGVNHDLKTPVHGLLASAELLHEYRLDGGRGQVSSHEVDCIRSIQHCSKTLIEVIDDVLSFSNTRNRMPLQQHASSAHPSLEKVINEPVVLGECVEHTLHSCWVGTELRESGFDNATAIFTANIEAVSQPLLFNRGELSKILQHLFDTLVKQIQLNNLAIDLTCKQSEGDMFLEDVTMTISATTKRSLQATKQESASEGLFNADSLQLPISLCKSFVEASNGLLTSESEGHSLTMKFKMKTASRVTKTVTSLPGFEHLQGKTFALGNFDRLPWVGEIGTCLKRTLVELLGMVPANFETADVIISHSLSEVERLRTRGVQSKFLVLTTTEMVPKLAGATQLVHLTSLTMGPIKLAECLMSMLIGQNAASLDGPDMPVTRTREQKRVRTKSEHDPSSNVKRQRVQVAVAHPSVLLKGHGGPAEHSPVPKVLCVDDNPINLKILAAVVAKYATSFDTATDGDIAVDKYISASPPFDLILLDLDMPRMDGFEACRLIRKYEEDQSLPRSHIVSISASGNDQAVACTEAGMDGHFDKPVSIQKLAHIIHSWSSTSSVPKDDDP